MNFEGGLSSVVLDSPLSAVAHETVRQYRPRAHHLAGN